MLPGKGQALFGREWLRENTITMATATSRNQEESGQCPKQHADVFSLYGRQHAKRTLSISAVTVRRRLCASNLATKYGPNTTEYRGSTVLSR